MSHRPNITYSEFCLTPFSHKILVTSFYSPYVPDYEFPISNSMVLSPSWEAASCAATQELPNILWSPKFHYLVHRSPSVNFLYCEESKNFKFLSLNQNVKLLLFLCKPIASRKQWTRSLYHLVLVANEWKSSCSGRFILVERKLNTDLLAVSRHFIVSHCTIILL
jgi:hypothetical protein